MEPQHVRPALSRRAVLCGTTCAASLAALSACGGGSTKSAGTDAKPSVPSGPLAATADVPVGSSISAKDSSGNPLIIAQPTQGEFVAYSAICTHSGCTVAPDGKQIKCPCHGSTYDLATGDNTGGPAPRPLAKVKVTVENGEIVA